MFTAILVLMVIVAILLIIVVLIQNPKGGGLSGEFGGGASQMFGVQRSGDIVEKLTWGFFTFIIVGSLLSGVLAKTSNSGVDESLNVEKAQTVPAPAAAPSAIPTPAPATTPTPAAPANGQ